MSMPPPQLTLPKIVRQMKDRQRLPVLAISGFNRPILAQEALTWLDK